MHKMKPYYTTNSTIKTSIIEYVEFLEELKNGKTDGAKWESRLQRRVDKLREKFRDNSDALKQLFSYDVLYSRFSGWVHPNGVEMGRYVQHHSDDYCAMRFDSDKVLLSEVLYISLLLGAASFIKYLMILKTADPNLATVPVTEVDEWVNRNLSRMSFFNSN